MRRRLSLLVALLVVGVLASGLGAPAKADGGKFEGTIMAPNPAPGSDDYAGLACGDAAGGPLNGVHYAWIDLKGDFTKFHLTGPARLFEDPAGQGIGDYDFDLYLYDAKCKDITTHTNGPESGMKTSTKRAARFALIIYWTGIHPDQPYTLQASN